MEVLAEALAEVEAERQNPAQCFGSTAADLSDWQQIPAMVEEVQAAVGTPDLLVNSAGVTQPGYFQALPLDVFRQMMAINYFGTLHPIQGFLPGMLARRTGYLVNISSVAGFLGVFGYSAYGASKFAVRGLSDVLRAELKPLGIGVSVVFPPDTDTPQLAYEAPYKPVETKALAGNSVVLSAQAVAQEILRGIERGQYLIRPGFDSKFLYWLNNVLGDAAYPLMDWFIARARSKKEKER
jgi:3-dehydrosphinganine reductase